jgi:hypothetical protein
MNSALKSVDPSLLFYRYPRESASSRDQFSESVDFLCERRRHGEPIQPIRQRIPALAVARIVAQDDAELDDGRGESEVLRCAGRSRDSADERARF